MNFYKDKNWHFRDNKNRKNKKKNGKHPSLIVGESNNGKKYINIGLTHSDKRGHHKNIQISNPVNWNEISYLRDDVREDDIYKLSAILKDYKLNPKDISKINKILDKYKKKNSH